MFHILVVNLAHDSGRLSIAIGCRNRSSKDTADRRRISSGTQRSLLDDYFERAADQRLTRIAFASRYGSSDDVRSRIVIASGN